TTVDAVAREDLAGHVRAARDPPRDPRRRRVRRHLGRRLAPARDRHRRVPARALGLPHRRGVREAAREAQAERVVRDETAFGKTACEASAWHARGNAGPAVTVAELRKTYVVPEREAGLRHALRSLVRRRTREVKAVTGSRSRSAPAGWSASSAR